MLTRAQEGEILSQCAAELFVAGSSTELPPLLPVPAHLLDQQAWQWALHKPKEYASPHVMQSLEDAPQFAYRQGLYG